jgi:hypothetical protein
MSNELLKKESPKTNILICGDNIIRTNGNIHFGEEDIFHSPVCPKSQLIDEAISSFINGYRRYGKVLEKI